mmetsp:Transcript_24239/g.67139  ORF Transcript_24239/g.67139 Transcript_24239/m.67139 type:complete len:263 (+) Transcript_24239:870-1658(+)
MAEPSGVLRVQMDRQTTLSHFVFGSLLDGIAERLRLHVRHIGLEPVASGVSCGLAGIGRPYRVSFRDSPVPFHRAPRKQQEDQSILGEMAAAACDKNFPGHWGWRLRQRRKQVHHHFPHCGDGGNLGGRPTVSETRGIGNGNGNRIGIGIATLVLFDPGVPWSLLLSDRQEPLVDRGSPDRRWIRRGVGVALSQPRQGPARVSRVSRGDTRFGRGRARYLVTSHGDDAEGPPPRSDHGALLEWGAKHGISGWCGGSGLWVDP